MMRPFVGLPLSLVLYCLVSTSLALEGRAPSASSLQGTNKISAGWYPGWRSEAYPAGRIAWSKYTNLIYSFGETTPDPSVISLENSNEDYLSTFVKTAHDHNVHASLSIGGWGGSRFFSSNVGNAENRTAFVGSLSKLVRDNNLDGIDFDWEYPNAPGVGCNVHSPNDTANFLSFLQEFRQSPAGSNITLSAATFGLPWNDSSSSTSPKPMTDVKPFAEVLDFIAIMNYDVWNLWAPSSGPNAPLNDSCASEDHRRGSAVSSVQAWTSAGFPREKIVLGVPMYARSFAVPVSQALSGSDNKTIAAYPAYNLSDAQEGEEGDVGGPDVCGVRQLPSGIYGYSTLMERGYLASDGSGKGDIPYMFDECSQTPFVYNSTSEVLISYDNPKSFSVKGAFINDAGLKGFAAWDITTDHGSDLLDSILNAMVSGSTLSSLNVSGQAISPSVSGNGGSAPSGSKSVLFDIPNAIHYVPTALLMSLVSLYL